MPKRPIKKRTVLDEHLLVVNDRDFLPRQVLDLAVLDLPELISNLRDKA
jgi:hypothetical protein